MSDALQFVQRAASVAHPVTQLALQVVDCFTTVHLSLSVSAERGTVPAPVLTSSYVYSGADSLPLLQLNEAPRYPRLANRQTNSGKFFSKPENVELSREILHSAKAR